MKTVNNLVGYVQDELQDPRPVVMNRTKSELFLTVTAVLLSIQIGMYLVMYGY